MDFPIVLLWGLYSRLTEAQWGFGLFFGKSALGWWYIGGIGPNRLALASSLPLSAFGMLWGDLEVPTG